MKAKKRGRTICYNKKNEYNFELEKTLDEKVLLTKLKTALDKKQKRSISIDVGNTDRSFGTIFGSEITKRYNVFTNVRNI